MGSYTTRDQAPLGGRDPAARYEVMATQFAAHRRAVALLEYSLRCHNVPVLSVSAGMSGAGLAELALLGVLLVMQAGHEDLRRRQSYGDVQFSVAARAGRQVEGRVRQRHLRGRRAKCKSVAGGIVVPRGAGIQICD